jgi:hypothetical protein
LRLLKELIPAELTAMVMQGGAPHSSMDALFGLQSKGGLARSASWLRADE